MSTHEILVAARNLIERDGWCQHSLRRREPPAADALVLPPLQHCAWGALLDASKPCVLSTEDPEFLCAERALSRAMGHTVVIGDWNDAPDRTKEEVLAAFDRAIAATAPEPADPFIERLVVVP